MNDFYSIRRARPADLPLLPAIERAAARLLVGHAPDSVLDETSTLSELEAVCAIGHLWVAVMSDGSELPIGFAHVLVLEPSVVHLHEIDVHPVYGRRGVGTALVKTVCAWAAAEGFRAVTLSTFRDVPFNMPFYASLGFAEVGAEELTPTLASIAENWRGRGVDIDRRVIMRRPGEVSPAHGP